MPGCAAFDCSNRSEQGFVMKVFPKDTQRRAVWATRVNRENWKPTDNSYLCEAHFDENQWTIEKGKKKLKRTAEPTIFQHRPLPTSRKAPSQRNPDNKENSPGKLEHQVFALLAERDELKKEIEYLRNENLTLKGEINKKNSEIWRLQKNSKQGQDGDLSRVFNEDQVKALKNIKFTKWSDKTCEIALGLRFACGKSGYENILHLQYPFPSIRTLQRRLQNLRFDAGILEDVLSFLKIKVEAFRHNQEKCCVLLIDEMSISESVDFDVSTQSYIGEATIPGQKGRAKHALVFMLGGISTRWKQVVAYHFSNLPTDGDVMRNLVLNVLKETEKLGLEVVSVTSDMGASNQAMWKSFGITSNRNETKASIPHPFDSSRKINFMADVPHLLKNIRSSLISNKSILIPSSLQNKYNLPTNVVNPEHLEKLVNFQEGMDLKLAPKLTPEHLTETHFNKMKVSRATHVISNDTSAALKFISEEVQDSSYVTTAWFIRHVQKWFHLMTSRCPVLALSKSNFEEYVKAIGFLGEIITLFRHLQVINHSNKPVWKPIQTGVIFSTTAVINLQAKLLGEKKFHMLLTSRFSQDSLENLFSVIRSKQVDPTCLQFKNNLKLVCISQYLKGCTGSYDSDDGQFLTGVMEIAAINKPNPPATKIVLPNDWDTKSTGPFSMAEKNCLYNISGYLMSSMLKKNEICETCVSAVASKDVVNGSFSKLVKFKAYKSNCLYYIKEDIFNKLFVTLELTFRKLEHYITKGSKNCTNFITDKFQENIHIQNLCFPNCHNIKTKLIKRFVIFRLKIFAAKINKKMKKEEKQRRKSQYSSKSAAKLNKVKK